jgi:hypothetical protein
MALQKKRKGDPFFYQYTYPTFYSKSGFILISLIISSCSARRASGSTSSSYYTGSGGKKGDGDAVSFKSF